MSELFAHAPELIGSPALLQERIKDIPGVMWTLGDSDVLDGPCIAIIGARSCSAYGHSIARSWASELAGKGYGIVSGLARGVDAEAHRGALETPDGRTIAVMGCGIDRAYPFANRELWQRIQEHGCVVSEYQPGVEPAPWRFPARNRIIAGLSQAVVVVEARERSGALITADFALEYGVPVFAVPGETTSLLSYGPNDLLRRGVAKIATCPDDVLEAISSS